MQVLWPLIQLQRDMRHFHFHDLQAAHELSVKSSMFAQVHALDSQRGRVMGVCDIVCMCNLLQFHLLCID